MNNQDLINKVKSIKTIHDLGKNKLTLSEYDDLLYTAQAIVDTGRATTIIKGVADWARRNGLLVFEESGCYIVSFNQSIK